MRFEAEARRDSCFYGRHINPFMYGTYVCMMWCDVHLQRELIRHNQEKKRKSSGLLLPNPDRPSSAARRMAKDDSAGVRIGSALTSSSAPNYSQFGQLPAMPAICQLSLPSLFGR